MKERDRKTQNEEGRNLINSTTLKLGKRKREVERERYGERLIDDCFYDSKQ